MVAGDKCKETYQMRAIVATAILLGSLAAAQAAGPQHPTRQGPLSTITTPRDATPQERTLYHNWVSVYNRSVQTVRESHNNPSRSQAKAARQDARQSAREAREAYDSCRSDPNC